MFARHFGQGVVFRDQSIRQRVHATSHVPEQSLPHQSSEANDGELALSQIVWSNEAALCGEIQNGLMRIGHAAMELRNAGNSQ